MAENDKNTLKETVAQAAPSSGIVFERLSPKDAEEHTDFLVDAYKDEFNSYKFRDRDLVKRSWRWEYVDNPAASEGNPPVWICRMKDMIIAQVCFMPASVQVKDKTLKGGWCQDLMIRSQYRNMGLGYHLIRHALGELAGSVDIALVSGTNDASYVLLKNSGFTDLGFIGRNIRPALFDIGLFRKPGAGSQVKVSAVDGFDERFDRLWGRVSREIPCIIQRDRASLDWRFRKNPYLNYRILAAEKGGELVGYAVLRKDALKRGVISGLKVGIVSDILFDPRDIETGRALLIVAFQALKKEVRLVRCDMLCEQLKPVLRSAGFIAIKSNNRFLARSFNKESDAVIKDKNAWYLTYGDSDLDLS